MHYTYSWTDLIWFIQSSKIQMKSSTDTTAVIKGKQKIPKYWVFSHWQALVMNLYVFDIKSEESQRCSRFCSLKMFTGTFCVAQLSSSHLCSPELSWFSGTEGLHQMLHLYTPEFICASTEISGFVGGSDIRSDYKIDFTKIKTLIWFWKSKYC